MKPSEAASTKLFNNSVNSILWQGDSLLPDFCDKVFVAAGHGVTLD